MSAPIGGEARAAEGTSFPPYDPERRGQFGAKVHFLFQKRLRPVNDEEYARQVNRTGDPNQLKGFREWHHTEVAEKLGVSDPLIGYLRNGKQPNPKLSHVHKLAKFFDVPVQFLADVDEDYSTPALERKLADLEVERRGYLADDQSQVSALAYGLNVLFDVIVPPGGDADTRYTEEQVAEATGVPAAEIRAMRDGSTTDVEVGKVRALAMHFGVAPVYLIGDPSDKIAAETDQDLTRMRMLNEMRVRNIAARLLDLKPQNRNAIANLMEYFFEAEQKDADNQNKSP